MIPSLIRQLRLDNESMKKPSSVSEPALSVAEGCLRGGCRSRSRITADLGHYQLPFAYRAFASRSSEACDSLANGPSGRIFRYCS